MLDYELRGIDTKGMHDQPEYCSDESMVRAMGWKVHTSIVCNPLEDRWMVFLVRDEQRILARASELEDAWKLAAEMIETLDEHGI